MLRVIFDTNIYGDLALENDSKELGSKIRNSKDFVVYGYTAVRKELRNISKESKKSRKVRLALLQLYDTITEGHFLENSLKITHLARQYYDTYRNYGGIYNWETNIRIDFMIVACASIHGLDIVYSSDSKTLISKPALKAYKHVNLKECYRRPDFFTYEELLALLRMME